MEKYFFFWKLKNCSLFSSGNNQCQLVNYLVFATVYLHTLVFRFFIRQFFFFNKFWQIVNVKCNIHWHILWNSKGLVEPIRVDINLSSLFNRYGALSKSNATTFARRLEISERSIEKSIFVNYENVFDLLVDFLSFFAGCPSFNGAESSSIGVQTDPFFELRGGNGCGRSLASLLALHRSFRNRLPAYRGYFVNVRRNGVTSTVPRASRRLAFVLSCPSRSHEIRYVQCKWVFRDFKSVCFIALVLIGDIVLDKTPRNHVSHRVEPVPLIRPRGTAVIFVTNTRINNSWSLEIREPRVVELSVATRPKMLQPCKTVPFYRIYDRDLRRTLRQLFRLDIYRKDNAKLSFLRVNFHYELASGVLELQTLLTILCYHFLSRNIFNFRFNEQMLPTMLQLPSVRILHYSIVPKQFFQTLHWFSPRFVIYDYNSSYNYCTRKLTNPQNFLFTNESHLILSPCQFFKIEI